MGRVLLGVLPCCLTSSLPWVAGSSSVSLSDSFLCCSVLLGVLIVVIVTGQSALAMARWCCAAAGSNATDIHIAITFVNSCHAKAQPARDSDLLWMSILGEVSVTLHWVHPVCLCVVLCWGGGVGCCCGWSASFFPSGAWSK